MKKYDPRLWIGALMVFGGVLILLENLNIISNVSGIFWGAIWGLVGLFFLYLLISDRNNWWAAFPAFTLIGLAASSFLPKPLEAFEGLVFSSSSGWESRSSSSPSSPAEAAAVGHFSPALPC